jgi:hypothetical protein
MLTDLGGNFFTARLGAPQRSLVSGIG